MKKNCSEFEILLSAAVDGELEPSEFAELEAHVDHCCECHRQYQNFETVNDWLVTNDRPGCTHDQTEWKNRAKPFAEAAKQMLETSGRNDMESVIPVNGQSHAATSLFSHQKQSRNGRGSSDRGRTFLAGGFLAATAAGLAALLATAPDETESISVTATDISIPFEKVSFLNEQSCFIQDSQTKAIQQELRTLKLMALHSNGDAAEISLFEDRINAMMKRAELLTNASLSP